MTARSEFDLRKTTAVFEALLRREVVSLERIGGGRNSKIYRVVCGTGESYAGKIYFRGEAGRRDRLGVEFGGLQFLWENGIRDIPKPIAADSAAGCALYEYVEGIRIPSKAVTAADVDFAVDFLGRLKELRQLPASRKLAAASDAAFSAAEAVENIKRRLDRLSALEPKAPPYPFLRDFLQNRFRPALEKIACWSRAAHARQGWRWDEELGPNERTLSPSDFGFHNALRRPSGRLVFLDFEYFGWDAPAKMISDFLLHPAMQLSDELKRRFLRQMLVRFADFPHLAKRVEVVYPLFGLNWCLIILNEFVPEDLRRRQFAVGSSEARATVQTRQLAKARRLLQAIMKTHDKFPYYG